jgi:hypothetical protein
VEVVAVEVVAAEVAVAEATVKAMEMATESVMVTATTTAPDTTL